jgi:hypothetical protein
MASSCGQLAVLVPEMDHSEGQRLPNWTLLDEADRGGSWKRKSDVLFSHVAVPLTTSPVLPPALRYVTFRSVETPVENLPMDATAKEPPRSTMLARVPPWRVPSRFCCFLVIRIENDPQLSYSVLPLDVKLKVDSAGRCRLDAELEGADQSPDRSAVVLVLAKLLTWLPRRLEGRQTD